MNYKILILCTGNSARSQMAEGLLKSYDPGLQIFSAGTDPAEKVNPFAIQAMDEIAIDISGGHPKDVRQFLDQSFDYVITVCDHAKETCPVFTGPVKHRLHLSFEDPAEAEGSDEQKRSVFRKVRDQIKKEFYSFYTKTLKPG